MTAYREDVFGECESRLRAETGAVEVERLPEGDPAQFPALHLLDGGQRSIEDETGAKRWELSLTVEGFVEGGYGTSAHADLNTLHADAVRALLADGENLNGLVELITADDMRVDAAALSGSRRLAFAQDFTVQLSTLRSDPSQRA